VVDCFIEAANRFVLPSKLANGAPTLQPSNGIVGICGEQLVQQLNAFAKSPHS